MNKNNIAIIGCSVALGYSGTLSDVRFSTILNKNKNINVINYSIGNQNIAEIYVQFYKFVKNKDFNKVIYIYCNDHFYFCKNIEGNIYTTPIIIKNNKIYNIKNNENEYKKYLLIRFLNFINKIKEDGFILNKEIIVIISPPSIKHIRFNEIYNIDKIIYSEINKIGIKTYNFYEYGIQNKDFFIDKGFHLNKKGHLFYAMFIEKIL